MGDSHRLSLFQRYHGQYFCSVGVKGKRDKSRPPGNCSAHSFGGERWCRLCQASIKPQKHRVKFNTLNSDGSVKRAAHEDHRIQA